MMTTELKFKQSALYISKILFEGVVIGIITGIIVSYLFTTPKISLTDTTVKKSDNFNKVRIAFENSGQSPAKNLIMNFFFGYENSEPKSFRQIQPKEAELVEPGDAVSYEIENFPNNNDSGNVLLFIFITYKDTNYMRQLVNRLMLGNDYQIAKWMVHLKDKNIMSAVSSKDKDSYEKELFKRMKTME